VFYPPNSNVLDRSSRYNRWQIQRPRAELERMLNQYNPVGSLVDVEVLTRGESGRVVDLKVTGTAATSTVHGFQIRAALGLRDTLFVIDRTYDEQGLVDQFIFTGRGWGHGVGLCQVGAYGMAVAGAGYKDILKKYYTGVKIDKIY
jgi:stage II sporulation protein D